MMKWKAILHSLLLSFHVFNMEASIKKKKKKLPLKHISAVLSKKQNKNTQANNNNKERNRNRDKMKNAKSHKQVINLQNTPLAFSTSHGGTAISRREKE